MSFKPIKLLCLFLCLVLGLSLMAAPSAVETKPGKRMGLYEFLQTLPEDTREQVCCIVETAFELHDNGVINENKSGFDMNLKLEDVLTPEQLRQFKDIFTRKPLSATATTTCSDCNWPNYFIYKAMWNVEEAIEEFIRSAHYCEPAPPSQVSQYEYVITRC